MGANDTTLHALETRKLPMWAIAWHKVPKRQLMVIVN